ncbi:uracil-DNA glycosylase [Chthonobacter rhizosphaerae]|uniref:uracil-DNA glycosylase n=1 Tax=Chthonobacter rhizosphaerae TaxID=2735553 RepID=UPI0015EFD2E0|nr:uracil-DNA glycosylase [Chthonobacter rhizosphaerae]
MSDLPPSSSVQHALLALLDWYAAMGVDAVLDEAPVDRFAESAAERERAANARRAPAGTPGQASIVPGARTELGQPVRPHPGQAGRPQPMAPPLAATVPGTDAVMAARTAAAAARSLDELHRLLLGFDGCNLKLTAKSLVFGDGNPAARVMFVGEAPGRDEDLEGRPFVGRSGQLLDRMLKAVDLSRETDAYIANVIYWRPPGNRDPSDQEVAICRPFICRQIELVNPDFLVFLGAQPAKALVGGEAARTGIRKLRGRWLDYDTGTRVIKALPTFHPAYLLRNPVEKRMVWRDLLALRAAMTAAANESAG